MTTTNNVEILLVDDDPSDIELTIHVLRSNHLANAIHVAEDGQEALDFVFCRGAFASRAADVRPKVILLDLKLPKVSGIDVLRTLKADERTRAIPVVILTSSKEQRDLIDGYKLGVSAYIQKPVDFVEFRNTVKEIGLFWLVVNQPPPAEVFPSG